MKLILHVHEYVLLEYEAIIKVMSNFLLPVTKRKTILVITKFVMQTHLSYSLNVFNLYIYEIGAL